jgi:hypothetical protein
LPPAPLTPGSITATTSPPCPPWSSASTTHTTGRTTSGYLPRSCNRSATLPPTTTGMPPAERKRSPAMSRFAVPGWPGRYNATVSRGVGRLHNGPCRRDTPPLPQRVRESRLPTARARSCWCKSNARANSAAGFRGLSGLRAASMLRERCIRHPVCTRRGQFFIQGSGSFAFGVRSVCVLSACMACLFTVHSGAGIAPNAALSYMRFRPDAVVAMTHCAALASGSAECRRVD